MCDECRVDEINAIYRERNLCVALIAELADLIDIPAYIAEHEGEEWDKEWRNVLFLELPTGQVSWHLHESEIENFPHIPRRPGQWDGHSTEEKYKRIKEYINV